MERDKNELRENIGSYSVYLSNLNEIIERYVRKVNAIHLGEALEETGDLSQETLGKLMENRDERLREICKEHVREGGFADDIMEAIFKGVDRHLSVREPMLREAILPYIEEAVAAAMGAGLAPHFWALAADRGLEDGIYFKDGKWLYTAPKDLSEGNRKALRETAEEIYDTVLFFLGCRNKEKTRDFVEAAILDEKVDFKPYPLDGGGRDDLASLVGEEFIEHLPSNEDGDLFFFIPFVVHRIDEAVYYSLAYTGDEYLQYIQSLSVEKDWDTVNGGKYGQYRNITERR